MQSCSRLNVVLLFFMERDATSMWNICAFACHVVLAWQLACCISHNTDCNQLSVGNYFRGPGHALGCPALTLITCHLFFVGAFVDVEKVDERVSIVYTRSCVVC